MFGAQSRRSIPNRRRARRGPPGGRRRPALSYASLPMVDRAAGWTRRNRRRLLRAAPLALLAVIGLYVYWFGASSTNQFKEAVRQGNGAYKNGDYESALVYYNLAVEIADANPLLGSNSSREADALLERAKRARRALEQTGELHRLYELYKYRVLLIGENDDRVRASREVRAFLKGVWDRFGAEEQNLKLLDAPTVASVRAEADDLAFLSVVVLADSSSLASAQEIRKALEDTARHRLKDSGPWKELDALLDGKPIGFVEANKEGSPRICLQYAVLHRLVDDKVGMTTWLNRAQKIDESDFWANYCLGNISGEQGFFERAYNWYCSAIALRPQLYWPRSGRGRLLMKSGFSPRASEDFKEAIALAKPNVPDSLLLDLAAAYKAMGQFSKAVEVYERLLKQVETDPKIRAASAINLAKLEFDSGRNWLARSLFEEARRLTETQVSVLEASAGSQLDSARIDLGLARIDLEEGRLNEAEAQADRSDRIESQGLRVLRGSRLGETAFEPSPRGRVGRRQGQGARSPWRIRRSASNSDPDCRRRRG